MALMRKDLLGLKGVSAQEIDEILTHAETMKQIVVSQSKKTPHMAGKSVMTLFYENSTRTRTSFEMACKYMSAATANIAASSSSVAKGETLIDTGHTLDQMGTDVIIIRHPMGGAPKLLAENVHASVINAGDGLNEHPTQALLDMFTMKQHFGGISGLKVAIVGDVYHSRVARSNLWGLQTMGADVTFAGPATLLPEEFAKAGAKVTNDVREAVNGADVVMALRIQRERQKAGLFPSVREYNRFFGLTDDVLKLAKKDAIVMHPGPVNRGVELTSSVRDGSQSTIDEQVQSGVAVRMAVLYLITRRSAK